MGETRVDLQHSRPAIAKESRSARSRISGLVEVPDLAACLTLGKNDFVRTGPRGASYLAYRKAIQEVVSSTRPELAGTARLQAGRD